jgi:homoserine dehydrogenase
MKFNPDKIGIIGYGTVGQALYRILTREWASDGPKKPVIVRDLEKSREVAAKQYSTDPKELLGDPEIELIVEVTDDVELGFHVLKESLEKGKSFVSANKRMIAEQMDAIAELRKGNEQAVFYEAAVCGTIPIIRTVDEHYRSEPIERISGVMNGTCNYMLSKMEEGKSYDDALKEAQDEGFAESDPTSDVSGRDAYYKSIILAHHAFGLPPEKIQKSFQGIEGLTPEQLKEATKNGGRYKLISDIGYDANGTLQVDVRPQVLEMDSPFLDVENEYNGVLLEGRYSGPVFLSGKGAGGAPTASAVFADIAKALASRDVLQVSEA